MIIRKLGSVAMSSSDPLAKAPVVLGSRVRTARGCHCVDRQGVNHAFPATLQPIRKLAATYVGLEINHRHCRRQWTSRAMLGNLVPSITPVIISRWLLGLDVDCLWGSELRSRSRTVDQFFCA